MHDKIGDKEILTKGQETVSSQYYIFYFKRFYLEKVDITAKAVIMVNSHIKDHIRNVFDGRGLTICCLSYAMR